MRQRVLGGGGVGGVSRLRFPPGPHLRSSRFSRHPRLRQAPTRRFAEHRNFCGGKRFGGPGPSLDRHSHRFTSSCCISNAWVRAATITPNPLTLGGVGWFPSGALQSHERRGSAAGRFGDLANKPLSPASRQPSRVKISKHAPVLIGS